MHEDDVTLYHRTTAAAADLIFRDGFRDSSGNFGTARTHSGVWLSDVPLDPNEGTADGPLLSVSLQGPLEAYEWTEEGKGYREFLIPARLLNGHATVRRLSDEEEEDLYYRTHQWPEKEMTQIRKSGSKSGSDGG